MERKQELLKVFSNNDCKDIVINLIDEMLYLEDKLSEYKKILKETPITSKTQEKYKFYHSLYKDSLNQYTNIVGKLSIIISKDGEGNENSPLRKYFNKLQGEKNE